MSTELQDLAQLPVASEPSRYDPVEILCSLIALPSVNPNSHDLAGPEYHESRMTAWLGDFFESLDVPCLFQEVHPGRHNVIAQLMIPGATRTVLLDAHQDTVPVEGMIIPPFQPVIRNGRLYGRGACDVKGGMAAMLSAFAQLAEERPAGSANVLMACTVDEEYTATGAQCLADIWEQGSRSDLGLPVPDLCLVAEPTDLNVIVAHRGVVRWKICTAGRACHSSQPENGVNAIYKMARILDCLEDYARMLAKNVPHHPLCGGAALSVGRISGGISVNIVPDQCEIEIDRRLVPGETPSSAMQEIETYLRSRLDVDFEMAPPWVAMEALSDTHNSFWADELLQHIAHVTGPKQKQGALYGTNAGRYARQQIPSLIFGPGSISQAHTVDEWIEISQLSLARDVYARFCRGR